MRDFRHATRKTGAVQLGWLVIPVFVADLPLSLIGDVVTLPRVFAMRREWSRGEQTGIWPEWAKGNLGIYAVESVPDKTAESELTVSPCKEESAIRATPKQ
jgi:hypothetical protein